MLPNPTCRSTRLTPRSERGAWKQVGSMPTVNRDGAAERLMYSLGRKKRLCCITGSSVAKGLLFFRKLSIWEKIMFILEFVLDVLFWVIFDGIFSKIFYFIGYPIVKILTLGKYKKSSDDNLPSTVGFVIFVIAIFFLHMLDSLPDTSTIDDVY